MAERELKIIAGPTNFFNFKGAAVNYYWKHESEKPRDHYERIKLRTATNRHVTGLIKDGAIHIGTPPSKPGLVLRIDGDGRWHYDLIHSITIQGRIWKSKSSGNTYHGVQVYLNGKPEWTAPWVSLGGGMQFETTAIEWLRESGHWPESESDSDCRRLCPAPKGSDQA